MAVEVENTSQAEELLRVLKRRLWLILIPAGIIAILGVSYAIVVPKKYVAKAQVMVHDRVATMVRGSASMTAEGRVAPHKLKAPQLVKSVLSKLKWLEYQELATEVEAAEYRSRVNKNITVSVPPMERNVQQQLVKITFSHTRADLAEQFLLELVTQWQDGVKGKASRHLTDSRDQLMEQMADLEKKEKQLVATLLRLRRDNRIPPKVGRGQDRNQGASAPAFAELNRLQRRLEADKAAYEDFGLKLELDQAAMKRLPDQVPIPGSSARENGDVQLERLRKQLDAALTTQAAGNWAPGHTKYRAIQTTIRGIRAKIERLMGVTPEQEDHFNYVQPNAAKQALRDALEIREDELQRLANAIILTTDKLTEAGKRTRSLQDIYSKINQNEANLVRVDSSLKSVSRDLLGVDKKLSSQDGPQGEPFEVLSPVHATDKPVEPNAWLISIFSVVLGLGVGLGLAVALEFSKNCFRSINDIARSMEIPVLGAINRIETRRQRHVKRVQKLVLGTCMLMTMGVVGFTLWAWALAPHLLKSSVVESIDRLREVLG
ncbi:MAG: hypothetical protein JKY61_01060 [Planctomycetes bacterium]|nr:hypothetical protein [Planctomycetota bacterium]